MGMSGATTRSCGFSLAASPSATLTRSASGRFWLIFRLSLSAAQHDDRPAEPGVGGRHHVSAHRPRLSLSRRHHRLGEPCGSGVAYLQYNGYLVLPRCARRRSGTVWQAGDLSAMRSIVATTPTRAASSPVRPSPARWRAQGSRSPWMAAVVGWTTSVRSRSNLSAQMCAPVIASINCPVMRTFPAAFRTDPSRT